MKCPVCASSVKSQNKFCANCGTGLDAVDIGLMNNLAIETATSGISYPEKFLKLKPLPWWFSILVFWELILLADFLISYYTLGNENNLQLMAALNAFFTSITLTIVYCHHQLKNFFNKLNSFIDHSEIPLKEWYFSKLRLAYGHPWAIAAGVVISFMIVGSIANLITELSTGSDLLLYYRFGYFFMGFFFTGLGIWAIYHVIQLTREIAGFKVKVSVYQAKENSVLALGNLLFKMSIAIALTYSLIVLAAMLSPYKRMDVVLIWLVIAALTVLAFFIFPQLKVHEIMTREKEQRINAFSHHLDKAMEASLMDPSKENMQRLRELFELQQHLNNMSEWPFNSNALWQLITALLIPLLIAILDLIMK